jgi:hypothetical protein
MHGENLLKKKNGNPRAPRSRDSLISLRPRLQQEGHTISHIN